MNLLSIVPKVELTSDVAIALFEELTSDDDLI